MEMIKVKAGDILLAEPFMNDPNFKRSVVLITENDETGTLGLVINKASLFRVNEVLPDFPKIQTQVFMGGLIGLDKLNYLHSYPELIPESIKITDNLYWNGNFESLKKGIKDREILPHNIKFFIGYSGWGIGQLEDELKENSWIVKKDYHGIFKDSRYMWKDILEGMGGEYKLMANYPENPSLN
ncbi:MAG: YqgE/AlgH family protein [Chitinophagales bacterium]|nr:YqgE/AlgH family protein [Chitinophagales bacterium]